MRDLLIGLVRAALLSNAEVASSTGDCRVCSGALISRRDRSTFVQVPRDFDIVSTAKLSQARPCLPAATTLKQLPAEK